MPSPEAVAGMMKFNEDLTKAGALLALDGLHPSSKGARVSFSGGKPRVSDGPFAEAKEVHRRLLDDPGQVQGRGHRVGRRVPRADDEHRSRSARSSEMSDFPRRRSEGGRRSRCAPRSAKAGAEARRRPCAGESRGDVIGSRDGCRHPPHDRRGLAHRITPARSPASRASCATSGLAEDLAQDALVVALETMARRRASRPTLAPGSWPPPNTAPSISLRRQTLFAKSRPSSDTKSRSNRRAPRQTSTRRWTTM